MKLIFIPVFAIMLWPSIHAQYNITGRVSDDSNHPLAYASIILYNVDTTKVLAFNETNEHGEFSISVMEGNQMLKIDYIGYQSTYIQITKENVNKQMNVALKPISLDLKEVNVIGKKASIERKIDRWVLDVNNDIMASGSSVLQVLSKSPGVMVNQHNGSVAMAGKDDVKIMINGKLQYLQPNAVVDFLAGLSANKVDKIELITQPPSSQDAEGNAGLINIVLKHNDQDGINGEIAVGVGALYGYQGTTDASFNYNKSAFSLFSSIGILRNTQSQEFNFFKDIHSNAIIYNTNIGQQRMPIRTNYNSMVGMNYNAGKSTFGLVVNGYSNLWDMLSVHKSVTKDQTSYYDSIHTTAKEINRWNHYGLNGNYQYKWQENKTLILAVDYLHYNTTNPSDYDNLFYNANSQLYKTDQYKIEKGTPIVIKVARLDYLYHRNKWNAESGLKMSISDLSNNVSTSFLIDGVWSVNPNYSSEAKLNETILAAYHSMQYSFNEKTVVKCGLRYEHTNTTIDNAENIRTVDRTLSNYFPTLFFSHQRSSSTSMGISYSSRILRPTFNDLAPFIFFNDPHSLVTGNTNLLPATTHNIKLEYKYKRLLVFSQYSIESNPLAKFSPKYVDSLDATIYQTKNYDKNKTWSTTVSIPVDVTSRWQMMVNASFNYTQLAGKIDEITFRINNPYFSIMTNHTFNLGHKMSAECSAMYNSSGFIGGYILKPFGFVNLGWRMNITSRSVLTINAQNIFNTMPMRFSFHDTKTGDDFRLKMYFGRPLLSVSYKYTFGSKKVTKTNEFKAAEERKRID